MKEAIKTFFRYLLPTLFVVYIGFVACFTHVHVINGVIIAHVHIESAEDRDRTSEVPHSPAELVMYGQLSSIYTHSWEAPSFHLEEPVSWLDKKEFTPDLRAIFYRLSPSSFHLRAPPFHC